MKLITLIGDLVQSREIPRRDALQSKLKDLFKTLTSSRPDILSPYTITLGDEFQAVYRSPDHIFSDIWQILSVTHPHRCRFSMAAGSLATPVNPDSAIGMDGPAFYMARDTMSELKQSAGVFRIAGIHDHTANLINASLDLVSHECRTWRKNRFRILVELLNGSPVKSIASTLNLSETAVYKNIQDGALHSILAICHYAANSLNQAVN